MSASDSLEVDDLVEDYDCPICVDTMKNAFVTNYECIGMHLSDGKECPLCVCPLTIDDISPNYTLNELIKKSSSRLCKGQDIPEDWSMDDINMMLVKLQKKKAQMATMEKENRLRLLQKFLARAKADKERLLEEVNRQLTCVTADLAAVETGLKSLHVDIGASAAQVPDALARGENHTIPADEELNRGKKRSAEEMEESPENAGSILALSSSHQHKKLLSSSKLIQKQNSRIEKHIGDLQERYWETRLSDCDTLDKFASNLTRFSRFSSLRPIATLNYADSLFSNGSAIVSSLEFDKDDMFFATAGVMKKIKIFEYGSVLLDYGHTPQRSSSHITEASKEKKRKREESMENFCEQDVSEEEGDVPLIQDDVPRFPVLTMSSRSKISCLTWNPYIRNHLVSSDYEGIVTLWDAGIGRAMCHFEEHEKRAWSVDWCQTDPLRLASGGDDTKVKIWSTNQKNSVATIHSAANVCSVKFNPENSNHIAFGSADHKIHYYDIRDMRAPLHVFEGHRKAVSYVKFQTNDTILSASTDCTLRLWSISDSIASGQSTCVRTFSGHSNEKNFVGLSVNRHGEIFACGSETNDIYLYWWQVSNPVVVKSFGKRTDTITGQPTSHKDTGQFVSSVCWKRNSSGTLLAANSQGKVSVMEIV
ncbi:hypothetical protein SpCBS45565_g05208 [Spizellomyces sp. 'palustris']|nr:hypothetical protein SpCBS45565_g05208 [Spizellomyces sp. 'palustris']